MLKLKNIFFIISLILTLFSFNKVNASVSYTFNDQTCGHVNQPGYLTALCDVVITMNDSHFNAGQNIDANVKITDAQYMNGQPGPQTVTWDGQAGTYYNAMMGSGGIRSSTNGVVQAPYSNGCYELGVYLKWSLSGYGGPYEHIYYIPYQVGTGSCDGGNGGGNSSGSVYVNAWAGNSEIPSGTGTSVNYSSVNAASCNISYGGQTVAQYCPTSGSYMTGNLVNTSTANPPANQTKTYTVTCGTGNGFTGGTPYNCSGDTGGSQAVNDKSKDKFFSRALNWFRDLNTIPSVLAEQVQSASKNVDITVTPVTITLNLVSGKGNDGNGKDLVDALNTDGSGTSHLVAIGVNTAGDCRLYRDGVLDDGYENDPSYGSTFPKPFYPDNIPNPETGSKFQMKCNNNTLLSDIVTIKGQDVSGFEPGSNYSSQLQCQNPNQGGAAACCVLPANVTNPSCSIPYDWMTINPQSGETTKLMYENTIIQSGNTVSNSPINLGIGTLANATTYTLYNKVDGETSGSVDNMLGQVKLISECPPGYISNSNSCVLVPSGPDLIAQNLSFVTPAQVGSATSVSATIKNQGDTDMNISPVYNFFQTTNVNPNTSGGTNISYKQNWVKKVIYALFGIGKVNAAGTPGVGPTWSTNPVLLNGYLAKNGGSKTLTTSVTFPTVGDYWIRACADKSSASNTGNVVESIENNNCSQWKYIQITEQNPLVSPNLTASATSPSVAVVNTPTTFSSTITNTGDGSTGASFYNLFQTKPNLLSNTITDYPVPLPMSALSAGASANTSRSITFTTVGTVYMRACADKSSASSTGSIPELNESDNCSEWKSVTINTTGGPDLTITKEISPTTTTVNTPTSFISQIQNIGTIFTNTTFLNVIQRANDISGTGATTLPVEITAGPITAASSQTVSFSYTFTTSGKYYVRMCADRDYKNGIGTITELNESNNCGPWTELNVVLDGVDLTAGSPIPTSAVIGSATTFRSVITNSGTSTTPSRVYGLFQTSSSANGSTNVVDYPTTSIDPIPGGATGTIVKSITIDKLPIYMRACADKDSAISAGYINETNENNNCSDWVSIQENQCSNGATNYPECTVDEDGKCLNGATNPPKCDDFTDLGGKCDNSKLYGCLVGNDTMEHSESKDYYYWYCSYNNIKSPRCYYPTGNGGGTTGGNVMLTAVPSWIFKGKTSTLTWSSWDGAKCEITPGTFGELTNFGNLRVSPSETTLYTVKCGDGTDTGEATTTVKVINPSIFEN